MNITEILKFLMPFSNEISNALTISGEGIFKRLYVACPHSWDELTIKTFIDVLALIAICWNVADTSHSNNVKKGILVGALLIIVAFIIPNLFMEPFVNNICDTENKHSHKCDHLMRFLTAVGFIFILFICEHFGIDFIKNLKI